MSILRSMGTISRSEKKCSRCHKKPRGKNNYCVECNRLYQREWARRKRGYKPRKVRPKTVKGIRYCSECDRTYEVSEFFKNAARADGLSVYCKKCEMKRINEWKRRRRSL